MSRRYLVTGGAGFLGSHLCERLVASGAEVECLDSLLTGRVANVEHLLAHERFALVRHDVTEPYEPAARPDVVLHLASPASPPAYLAHPVATLLTGALGTRSMLDVAERTGATFLLASTSEVYGDPEVSPQPETYRGNVSTTGPRSVYDEAKRFAEALTMAYQRERAVEVRIARIFNTYGPRLTPGDGRVVSNFISQALTGEPLTVYGNGSQTRSLCYVDDLVDGLLALLEYGDAEPVNLGNPDERSVLAVALLVIQMTGSSSDVVFRPLPEDDPRVRCPDVTRAHDVLGWSPKVPLEDGLARTIEWSRSEALGAPSEADRRASAATTR